MLHNALGFLILLFTTRYEQPNLVSHCTGDTASPTEVMNFPGWDFKTFGWVRFDVQRDVRICNFEVAGGWSDDEVAAARLELWKSLNAGKHVVLVGYSMTAPFVAEVVDTSDYLRYDPNLLEQISLLMIAPAAAVKPGFRSTVKSKAQRWEHAWLVHFETNIIQMRDHDRLWNAFIDRITLVQADVERVVDYGGIQPEVLQRLGDNVRVAPGASHIDLRNDETVNAALAELL